MNNLVTYYRFVLLFLLPVLFSSCDDDDKKAAPRLELTAIRVGTYNLNPADASLNNAAPIDQPLAAVFSHPLDPSSLEGNVVLRKKHTTADLPASVSLGTDNTTVKITPSSAFERDVAYTITFRRGMKSSAGSSLGSDKVVEFRTAPIELTIESILVQEIELKNVATIRNVDPNDFVIQIQFSHDLDASTVNANSIKVTGATSVSVDRQVNANEVTLTAQNPLRDWSKYQLSITNVKGSDGGVVTALTKTFYTGNNGQPDFPLIDDESLLTLVQQQTFKYFWDFAHPASGMARERNTSGNLVTSGGSGFGVMAIIVGIERGFITRQQGIERLDKILSFLETADRFHGAWSHWIDGNTGKVIPFSANDNGGDLVETSFLIQGLLTFRQYLNPGIVAEKTLIDRINALWQAVEWDWYTRDGQQVLYWHWSPDKAWTMNHQIRGHNETLITYVLAASSPTHAIGESVYHEGYARSGAIKNGNSYYGITLPLGGNLGGPLFFAHYSFLGLDPRSLEDQYANYWTQNTNHTLINQAYAIDNPKNYIGYSEEGWGLTASDTRTGYSAHSPTNDLGVITPTAALSSFPYSPEESWKALRFFYYSLGDRLWGDYGFYDAFDLTEEWTAGSYLAIDQGPIIIMIENHRTGLLWDLFMSAPEVQNGLTELGFNY